MRRRRHKEISASINEAARASREASERLAAARDLIATQKERYRAERVTVIAALRNMRQQDNLARMLLDTVEKEAGNADDPGAAGGGTDQ